MERTITEKDIEGMEDVGGEVDCLKRDDWGVCVEEGKEGEVGDFEGVEMANGEGVKTTPRRRMVFTKDKTQVPFQDGTSLQF